MANISRLVQQGLRAYRLYQRAAGATQKYRGSNTSTPRTTTTPPRQSPMSSSGFGSPTPGQGGQLSKPYLGDWTGPVNPQWVPKNDGRPDPGEVVWTWVPFQEDHTQGKDRPVLVVDRAGDYLLCLMLTSKDHDTASYNDLNFVEIGVGPWDTTGRPSEVRLNRVIPVLVPDVRRPGAVLDKDRFDTVAQEFRNRR